MFVCLKSSNIEGNTGRSASDLISLDAKYFLVNLFYVFCCLKFISDSRSI